MLRFGRILTSPTCRDSSSTSRLAMRRRVCASGVNDETSGVGAGESSNRTVAGGALTAVNAFGTTKGLAHDGHEAVVPIWRIEAEIR
jgi:hypothetical protein